MLCRNWVTCVFFTFGLLSAALADTLTLKDGRIITGIYLGGNARQIRVNDDYHRRGAVAYLAADDVHRGKVFGRCDNTTGLAAFTNLVAQVMTHEPYA